MEFIKGLGAPLGALVWAAGCAAASGALGQTAPGASQAPPTIEDLRNYSLEQLAELQVSSVSKRPESLNAAPASVFIITSEDIRRSAATSLPEALRLAPNLEVARLNAYSWTVSARGFNSPEASNKLLVLIDGRSVYEPIGGGVLWQQIPVALDEIERIEVIAGPGGTLWGANAVNGVINVILKKTRTTEGVTLTVSGGGFEQSGTMMVGGSLGAGASYRLFANAFNYGETRAVNPTGATSDAFQGVEGGGQVDGAAGSTTYSLRALYYRNAIADQNGVFRGDSYEASLSHPFSATSTGSVFFYFDEDYRNEPTLYEGRRTFDLQAQDTLAAPFQNTVVWGGEVHVWDENFISYDAFTFARPRTTITLGSLFGQDEWRVRPDLTLTLGMKLEDNSYSGLDWLPNARLSWSPSANGLVWAAISRAVRTPNRIERELQAPGFLAPSPYFQSEKLVAFELGARAQPTPVVNFSVSTYYNLYQDLRDDEFSTPPNGFPIVLRNNASGSTYGIEAWSSYQVLPWWRLRAGANFLHKDLHVKTGHVDISDLQVGGQDPAYQTQVRSEVTLPSGLEFDADLRDVDHVSASTVKGYAEADARLAWRLSRRLELSINGENLLHAYHLEVDDPSTLAPRYIPRSVFARLRSAF